MAIDSGRACLVAAQKGLLPALLLGIANITFADPVTPPGHSERDYRTIGGGLYLRRDEDLTADEDGNILVTVFSHTRIHAGENYTLDMSALAEMPIEQMAVDAGTFGLLRMQMITIDCAHQTYEVFDTRKLLPQGIWRAASTLPVLAPVFAYACKHAHASSGGVT